MKPTMPKPRKPPPVLEVLVDGPWIYPEQITLGTLTQAFSAIRRLATGREPTEEDEDGEAPDGDLVRLLDVVRGSALFRFVGLTPDAALDRLRLAGKVLHGQAEIGENDYILRLLERLSASARRLECSIIVREPGPRSPVLARIEPDSYEQISRRLFIAGETSITGSVERVDGATEVRCALRVPFQRRLLFCRVASVEVARKLDDRLYQEVAASGAALWLKQTWRIVTFTINDVRPLERGTLGEAMEALREAGGRGWDDVDDPEGYLEEVSGK